MLSAGCYVGWGTSHELSRRSTSSPSSKGRRTTTTMPRRLPKRRCGRTCGSSRRRARISWTCRPATGCGRDWSPDEQQRSTKFGAFLIEQGIAVRIDRRALRKSLFAILENRKDEISPRTAKLIRGLHEDWCCLDERIETVTSEIEALRRGQMPAVDECSWGRAADLDCHGGGNRQRRGFRTRSRFCRLAGSRATTI